MKSAHQCKLLSRILDGGNAIHMKNTSKIGTVSPQTARKYTGTKRAQHTSPVYFQGKYTGAECPWPTPTYFFSLDIHESYWRDLCVDVESTGFCGTAFVYKFIQRPEYNVCTIFMNNVLNIMFVYSRALLIGLLNITPCYEPHSEYNNFLCTPRITY